MLHTFASVSRSVIEYISVVIILAGVALCVWRGVRLLAASHLGRPVARDAWIHLRLSFEDTLMLGLQFLMAADIIGTISDPDVQGVIVLAAIVLMRVILSFTVSREVAEMQRQEREHEDEKS